ncbi:MAG: hypothetical protein AABX72_04140 [Nanoarchaeota archaeon]
MRKKRGQAAIEYVILVGTLMVFLIPVVYYALNESSYRVKMNQIDNAVKRVAKVADVVYALGPGAQDVVVVTIPYGVLSSGVGNYSINLKVSALGGNSDYGFKTVGNVTGSLPILPGTYRILIKHLADNVVNVSVKP